MKNCWLYKGKCLETPEGYGFCYKITCTHPDYSGYIYVGKKSFTSSRNKKIPKKVRALTKTRKKKERIVSASDWENYWGSSIWLKEVRGKIGNQYFIREILSFAKNKTDLSLQEWEWMIHFNVLRSDKSFNLWASGRIYKKHLG